MELSGSILKRGKRSGLRRGSVGLLTVMALKARGAGKITVVDIKDVSLKVAQECGADVVINSAKVNLDQYLSKRKLFDAVFETAGNPITQVQALKYAAKHAQVVFIGKTTKPTTFQYQEFEQILRKELRLLVRGCHFLHRFPGTNGKLLLLTFHQAGSARKN